MQKKLFILTTILIMFTTFAYSALATNLGITGEANFRAISDIRVTNIELDNAENGATLSYDPKYTKDTITNGFILPNSNSSISYNVTIKNKGTIDQAIYDLQTISSNNNDMIILIDDEPINEALPMIVPFGTSKTIKITYKTNSPGSSVINIINKFIFKEVYYVEYNTKGGSSVETQIKYKDVTLVLEGSPTKSKYVFVGWSESENSELVRYIEGSNYLLNEDKTLYAVWRIGIATFLDGATFNAKIKQLAGNIDATYETNDTNITSIVRANNVPSSWIVNGVITPPSQNNIVSTQDSDFPIYAWYDNGTINYYTIVDNPYMNSNASNMFRGLTSLTSISLNTIDTSTSSNMNFMFYNNSSLTSINLNTFNTSNVTNMSSMFNGCSSLTTLNLSNFVTTNVQLLNSTFDNCSSLTSLDLSSFNTSNVNDMNYLFANCTLLTSITFGNNFDTSNVSSIISMFHNCSSITSLDISKFNLSSITISDNIVNIFTNMTNLRQLKTPKVYPSNLSITLPNTFYSSNNTAYTALTSTSPTQAWIKLPYTVKFNANGGTGTMADQKIGVDATTTLTTNTFTRTGYTFNGWNTLADGTGTNYTNNASVTNLKTYNEIINLYAKWTANTYTIIFDKNDSSATGSMANQTATYDQTIQLRANGYTKSGFKLIGWNTESNGSGTTYLPGASVSNLAPSGNKTLYAMWQRVMAENVGHEEAELYCNDAQCMIDELYYMLY